MFQVTSVIVHGVCTNLFVFVVTKNVRCEKFVLK